MATITKKDLVDRIADATGETRVTVKKTIQSFLDNIIIELGKGNRLEFRDFGVFEVKHRAPRIAQNPKTLERVHVPAKRTVKFKVGRMMQQALTEMGDDVVVDDGATSPQATSAGDDD
ncbi:MAG: integration host factor subunit beta [Phycisphaera sp.]|nr:integration host factor subunit beta [Phycisphaera sp.]